MWGGRRGVGWKGTLVCLLEGISEGGVWSWQLSILGRRRWIVERERERDFSYYFLCEGLDLGDSFVEGIRFSFEGGFGGGEDN